MGEPKPKQKYTLEEYFQLEDKATSKHEFEGGEILAMTGGSVNHNRIGFNLLFTLTSIFRNNSSGCSSFNSDNKIYIPLADSIVYPDGFVVCGEIEYANEDEQTIINPIILFEVLSTLSEDYDRGGKFHKYRQLPSLKEYLLISQDLPQVERAFKTGTDTWEFTTINGLETSLLIKSLELEIPMKEIYYDIDWEKEIKNIQE